MADQKTEEYQAFLHFDWQDERWQAYVAELYPTPNQKQILRFKKKWYKKNIDADFDDSYEPPTASASTRSAGGGSTPSSSSFSAAYGDGPKWTSMSTKRASICFAAYAVALTMAVAAAAGAFPAYQALVVLVGAFVLEILAKYGLKLKTEWLHSVLLDDVGVMPMMALTLLTPGLHPGVRLLALVPPSLTALLSFAAISSAHRRLPASIKDFFSPLAEPSARNQVMQARADAEVLLGFVLVGAVFAVRAAPISALLFWNFMMMRHMMSPWTQASFRKIDGLMNPVLGRIPLVKGGYAAFKRFLYSFVDPESKRAGNMCSIL